MKMVFLVLVYLFGFIIVVCEIIVFNVMIIDMVFHSSFCYNYWDRGVEIKTKITI